ncbi:putative glutamine amidotransferase YafJ [uncultured Gammaproteobacteria bacterium]
MCELLGMNANVPTDIRFSFSGLMRRGGVTGPHRDGWGIAFYQGRGCRTFHDPVASADSEIAQLVRDHPIRSTITIAHIRRATHGRVCLENTHPFTRELWGRAWTFAHNGKLKGIKRRSLGVYRPIGDTDSEHAFCWLLGEVRKRFPERPASARKLWAVIGDLAQDLTSLGIFNMLLSDSCHLYGFCGTRLSCLTRRAPFGAATLIDQDLTADFAAETNDHDVVTVLATQPLTANENWRALAPGTLVVLRGGEVVYGG